MDLAVKALLGSGWCSQELKAHTPGRYMTRDFGHERMVDRPGVRLRRMIELRCDVCSRLIESTTTVVREDTGAVMPAETHGVFNKGLAVEARPAPDPT